MGTAHGIQSARVIKFETKRLRKPDWTQKRLIANLLVVSLALFFAFFLLSGTAITHNSMGPQAHPTSV